MPTLTRSSVTRDAGETHFVTATPGETVLPYTTRHERGCVTPLVSDGGDRPNSRPRD